MKKEHNKTKPFSDQPLLNCPDGSCSLSSRRGERIDECIKNGCCFGRPNMGYDTWGKGGEIIEVNPPKNEETIYDIDNELRDWLKNVSEERYERASKLEKILRYSRGGTRHKMLIDKFLQQYETEK